MYEVNLACGDTISARTAPTVGSYRTCIHCDSRKRVTGVIDPSRPVIALRPIIKLTPWRNA